MNCVICCTRVVDAPELKCCKNRICRTCLTKLKICPWCRTEIGVYPGEYEIQEYKSIYDDEDYQFTSGATCKDKTCDRGPE